MHLAQCPVYSMYLIIDSYCHGCWVGSLFSDWILRMKERFVVRKGGTSDRTAGCPLAAPGLGGCHRHHGPVFPTPFFS